MSKDKMTRRRIALVTGGTSGIGAACTLELADRGYQVIAAALNDDKGRLFELAMASDNRHVEFMKVDVRQPSSIDGLFDAIASRYGRLDVAVNSAGIEGAPYTHFRDYPDEAWHQVIAVNLTGVWLCMRHELKLMERQGSGSIVNISSLAGLRASVTAGCGYTASKHGLVGLTKSAALDFAKSGIRINSVCPGMVNTPGIDTAMEEAGFDEGIHPIGRICEPSEVAKAVAWLCDTDASFITGISLPVDGGHMAR